jgi:predicted anti-sigma-YlaC factor YlaD
MHYDADTLADYLHGELAPEQDAAVHAHLEGCGDCRALHADTAALRDWIRTAARAEERELPPGVTASIWAEVRAPRPTVAARLRGWWGALVAVPVAAAIAVAFAFGLPALQSSTAPAAVAVSYYLEQHAAQTAGNPFADRSALTLTALEHSAVPLIEAADTGTSEGAGAAAR